MCVAIPPLLHMLSWHGVTFSTLPSISFIRGFKINQLHFQLFEIMKQILQISSQNYQIALFDVTTQSNKVNCNTDLPYNLITRQSFIL